MRMKRFLPYKHDTYLSDIQLIIHSFLIVDGFKMSKMSQALKM